MPILQRFDNTRVLMYLDDLSMKGRVAEREIREALTWIEANKDFLFDEWRRNNP